ncbi:MAG: hypothetical protein LC114_25500 [Bryobacterales bacterium]|nr:hypothetical protein [Bryobacterales bacterium]
MANKTSNCDNHRQPSWKRRSFLATPAAFLLAAPARSADLSFHAARNGEFVFDTGALIGTFRKEGKSLGGEPVIYAPTNAVLTSSMGLFGIYRVFSAAKRYTKGMWYEASEANTAPDGSLAVHWPSTEERPYTLEARYRWAAPDTLDLTIHATARQAMEGFEVFLASYFSEGFNRSEVLTSGGKFLNADQQSGHWQMFPRDPNAIRLIEDGRWKIPPNPVDWAIRPEFEQPLACRRSRQDRLCAVVMARKQDCFAISTPYDADSHYALYLSLFGQDLKANQSARTAVRLAILPDADEEKISAAYSAFLRAHSL